MGLEMAHSDPSLGSKLTVRAIDAGNTKDISRAALCVGVECTRSASDVVGAAVAAAAVAAAAVAATARAASTRACRS